MLFQIVRKLKNIREGKMKKYKLDEEEQELLEMFEAGEFKSVDNLDLELKSAQQAAKKHLRKDARINIRLSSLDLARIKKISLDEGLPYQTLIASVLHKFANKHLDSIQ
jgi:predicted DNA binding CopG/RHH family protein